MSDERNDDTNLSKALDERTEYEKWAEGVFYAFGQAREAVCVRYIRDKTIDFTSVVAEFRAIEAEFLAHFRDDAENTYHVRRITAEMLLQAAWDKDQPFETGERYWNDVQQLGFHNIDSQCHATWLFGEICRDHGKTDTGLALVDAFITKLERLRTEPLVGDWDADDYDRELGNMRKLRARLEADRG